MSFNGNWDIPRAYLDTVNNVCHVGHCHPRVVEATQRQVATLNTNTRYLHPLLVEYAERLTSTFPASLSVCFLVNSGSEANELALRLARVATGRRDVVVVDHAYHGHTSSLIDLSPYKHDGPGGGGPPPWVHVTPLPDDYRGPHRDEASAGLRYAADVEAAVERLVADGRPPAAFFCESVIGCGGQIVPPEGYFREAYAAVRRHGGLCIADEVQVGFGRIGTHMWAFEPHGVVPDIVTVGKPIGNGHPMAAVITTAQFADAFANGMEFFATFGGNPVSCAVGLAVLDVIEDEGLQPHALRVGEYLKTGFAHLATRFDCLGAVRGSGLFLGIEFVRDRESRTPDAARLHAVVQRLRDVGILTSVDGPDHDVMKIKPPMCFDECDADLLLSVMERVLIETDSEAAAS